MTATTELLEPLARRGIKLSHVAIWRLVDGEPPRRLSLPILAALCDILHCTPSDLIQTSARPATKSTDGSDANPLDTHTD